MSLATDTLAFFRGQWAERFTDSCVVKRTNLPVTLNPTTGVYEPTFTTIYTGGCQVRPKTAMDADYGQQLVVVFDHVISIPWDEDGPTVNDMVDVTSTQDGKLTGKQFIVRGIPTDSLITHRILLCQDNQGA
jgi:Family of unknown function (DUF6093)